MTNFECLFYEANLELLGLNGYVSCQMSVPILHFPLVILLEYKYTFPFFGSCVLLLSCLWISEDTV
jgi:hypothetical protein